MRKRWLFFALVMPALYAEKAMVVSSHPLATKAGIEILQKGGSAIDAAIAVQMVLNVVEPQNAGMGGGGTLLYYCNSDKTVTVFEGRECAPLAASKALFLDQEGFTIEKNRASIGGLAVAVPGLLHMLDQAHRERGRLPWKTLFSSCIALAENGMALNPSSEALVSVDGPYKMCTREGKKVVKNKELAQTFHLLAQQGITPFYKGKLATEMVKKVAETKINPGLLSLKDLAAYESQRGEPFGFTYHNYKLYGPPPPASGAVALALIMGILERRNLNNYVLGSLEFINLFCQASQLAFELVEKTVADPAFSRVQVDALLDKKALAKLSEKVMPTGALPEMQKSHPVDLMSSKNGELAGTHVSVVDVEGNAVSLSASLGRTFGSKLYVGGFYLNNSLVDFNLSPEGFNAPEGGKRPMQSTAPTFVFDRQSGKLVYVIGSTGGSYGIEYVAEALLGLLEFKMPLQDAIDFPHFVALNEVVEVEKETFLTDFLKFLKGFGHKVRPKTLESGTEAIALQEEMLQGATDFRQSGLAKGF